jgi:hypothetical protein
MSTGADPGFQVRGGDTKIVWGISCEKSRFNAKKSYFFPILRSKSKDWKSKRQKGINRIARVGEGQQCLREMNHSFIKEYTVYGCC